MKTLLLMRHAKAINGDGLILDFDRGLNDRGKADASVMGKRLVDKQIVPDLIVCSAAKRTFKTAKLVAFELGYSESEIDKQVDLYEASVSDFMHVLRQIDDTNETVLVVAHNPTITGMVGYLSGDHVVSLPTSGQAYITFDILSWKQLMPQQGFLNWIDFPKSTQE